MNYKDVEKGFCRITDIKGNIYEAIIMRKELANYHGIPSVLLTVQVPEQVEERITGNNNKRVVFFD